MRAYIFHYNHEIKTIEDFKPWLLQAAERFQTKKNTVIPIVWEKDQFSLGIEKTGHSGGYWFQCNPIQKEIGILLCGKIQKIVFKPEYSAFEKILFGFGSAVIFLPSLVVSLFRTIGRKRLLKKFLVDYVGCVAC